MGVTDERNNLNILGNYSTLDNFNYLLILSNFPMKSTYEENNKRIDLIQKQIKQLKVITEVIGDMQDELQLIQSQNLIMAEEMKAGKDIQ